MIVLTLEENEIAKFLSHLAVKDRVAASTQNQAFNAILFLYKQVLKQDVGWMENVKRAKRKKGIPVVFTKEEAKKLLISLMVLNG